MKRQYRDKNGNIITEPGTLKFTINHGNEPSTVFKAVVKKISGQLGYFCENEKRVIPFYEQYKDTHIVNDAELI